MTEQVPVGTLPDDAEKQHLRRQLEQVIEANHNLKREFDDAERMTQVRSWAVDRAIRYFEIASSPAISTVDDVLKVATQFVDYTRIQMHNVQEVGLA